MQIYKEYQCSAWVPQFKNPENGDEASCGGYRHETINAENEAVAIWEFMRRHPMVKKEAIQVRPS